MKNYEQIIATLLAKIAELEKDVQQQAARIAELEKRLNKNSSNSSKPPSSDGLCKPPRTTSLRENGKHTSGGQKGHKGETLKQIESPDIIKKHAVLACPDCRCSLITSPVIGIMKRQVFDIPPPKIEVTEHQAEVKYCECCNKTITAAFPAGVRAPVQYGEVIRSWSLYYQYQHFVPEDRLQQLFSDLYGIQLATATLTSYNRVAFDALASFEESVLSAVKTAAVKNLDETGFRVAGKTQWLHVASTKTATYYHVSQKRKSLLDGLSGTVVHWKSYFNLEGVEHALCNQHHLRELKAITEHDKEPWAQAMTRLLRVALRCRHFHEDHAIPIARIKRLIILYDKIIQDGLAYHETLTPLSCKGKQGLQPRRTGHNLLLRLFHYKQDVLRFLHDSAVPFTNNDAERDLRMMKCKQKISGGFRSSQGAEQFARIRGFISTIRKQGLSIISSSSLFFLVLFLSYQESEITKQSNRARNGTCIRNHTFTFWPINTIMFYILVLPVI
jgi:transposase